VTRQVAISIFASLSMALSLCLCGAFGFLVGRATHTYSPGALSLEESWVVERARVTAVIDGDTIEVERGERVRYIGIDTPESDACYGPEATEANRELVEGKEVILIRDVENRDRYGRLLRYVITDGRFVNAELVRLGYAYPRSYGESLMFQQVLTLFGRYARQEERGLWTACPQ